MNENEMIIARLVDCWVKKGKAKAKEEAEETSDVKGGNGVDGSGAPVLVNRLLVCMSISIHLIYLYSKGEQFLSYTKVIALFCRGHNGKQPRLAGTHHLPLPSSHYLLNPNYKIPSQQSIT